MIRKLCWILALALSLLAPFAQAQQCCRANVPFAFKAGNVALPAGTYTVERITQNSVVLLRNTQSGQYTKVTVNSIRKLDEQGAKLVFHKYGTNSYLAEIWYGGTSGMKLPASERLEKEFRLAENREVRSNVEITLR